ncbi:hypothetical protein [Mesorhizobium sp. NZP2077]|uniref:hypothetical protein n=1 Tax=Mesorhizobium sp. NZP2077 TaxID=2483404 RepID=UPI001FEE9181|nr:hypothetical protein [Mesorhizobium sp. NZP2077]
MSQSVEPPILPEGSPDREVNCEVALEAAFAALVTTSEAQGWTPQETAATLLKIATEHAHQLEAAAAAELLTTKDEQAAFDMAKEIGGKVRVETITPKPREKTSTTDTVDKSSDSGKSPAKHRKGQS